MACRAMRTLSLGWTAIGFGAVGCGVGLLEGGVDGVGFGVVMLEVVVGVGVSGDVWMREVLHAGVVVAGVETFKVLGRFVDDTSA